MNHQRVDYKTAQLILYMSNKIGNLYITKLLKLLYIIDEQSTKETGVPVTWLDYNVWQYGPVNPELHAELTFEEGRNLSEFIQVNKNIYGKVVEPVSKFDDSEFSEYEMELIDKVIKDYGRLTSAQLVDLLHKNGTLWEKEVKENDLEWLFEHEKITNSPIKINFEDLFEKDPLKKHIYQSAKENMRFVNQNDCLCDL
jgi:uncharacterized phage-associated protein